MAGKRHHYLPQFLLRRFAATTGGRPGLVWRADISGRRVLQVAPKHEAAKRHYYRLATETALPPTFAEDVIGRIESMAAAVILKFERHGNLDLDDRHWLALFILLQHRRTPAGRRELRFMDEQIAKLDFELRVSDTEAVRRALEADGRAVSQDEVERAQQQTLEELRTGELVIESTADREVPLMFSQLEQIAPKLVEEFDWKFLKIPPEGGEVVLPDVGLTLFDPTPRFPKAGTGFASSPNAETAIHLGPRLVLMLRPGDGYGWVREAGAGDIETLNLRAYASSDVCIYGTSEEVVRSTLRLAEAAPARIERLRPRAPTLWIAESESEPQAGLVEFTGYSLDGIETQELYVSQEGVEEGRKRAIRYRRSRHA
jgi:Protein of unknown function (DUF4238)